MRSASTNILLDGVAKKNEFTASMGKTTPLDSVQELGIITDKFTAEYGHASGGIMTSPPNGSDQFHGSVYQFNRVSDLASNSFNNNAYGKDKPISVRNQFAYWVANRSRETNCSSQQRGWTRVRSAGNFTTITPDPELVARPRPTFNPCPTYGDGAQEHPSWGP